MAPSGSAVQRRIQAPRSVFQLDVWLSRPVSIGLARGLLRQSTSCRDAPQELCSADFTYHPVPRALPEFEDLGASEAPCETVLLSLEPALSKIWACGLAMDGNGSIRSLALGVTTGQLVMGDGTTWRAISQEDPDALLEVKGAFLTERGPVSAKDAGTARASP